MVDKTESMNWYRMFDKIQSVRVMGVVASFLITPFCRSSAFMFTAPDRLDVITDIAMMPGFLQTIARILPLYYVNEGLRASMVFVDNTAALRYSAVIGVFAAAVFVLGINTTKWEEGK